MLDAALFGAGPQSTPTANTRALNAAFATAAAAGEPCRLPPGTIKHDGPLVWPGSTVQLFGASTATVLLASAPGFTGLTIGGPATRRVGPNGWVRDLRISGYGGDGAAAPADGNAGLRLSKMVQTTIDRVDVTGYDMGFDLVDNCYGSEFRNCRTLFSTCNIGVNLRTGPQSGSDLSFYNCWLAGQTAAAHMSGDGGGYHFQGGQLGCGHRYGTTDSDSRAAIIAGRDYLTGLTGSTSFDLTGVSFEGTNHGWALATYDQINAIATACSFNPANDAHPAVGLLLAADPKNGRIALDHATVSGNWSADKLVRVTGTRWPQFRIDERGTYSPARLPSIAGVKVMVTSLLTQSGLA